MGELHAWSGSERSGRAGQERDGCLGWSTHGRADGTWRWKEQGGISRLARTGAALEEETAKVATEQQRELAAMIGVTLTGREPRSVVAVTLEEHLRPVIWGVEPELASDRQRALLNSFGVVEAAESHLSKRVASAWISHHLVLRTVEDLRRLALVRDDAVIKRSRIRNPLDGQVYEGLRYGVVSSIGPMAASTSVVATGTADGPLLSNVPPQRVAPRTIRSLRSCPTARYDAPTLHRTSRVKVLPRHKGT